MVANQTEYTWDLNLLSKKFPLNMTMTRSPELVKDSHLIKLNFDGTFHKQGGHFVTYSHDYFPDLTGTHREQLWIHQNTLNTLIASAAEHYKNIKLSSPELKQNLIAVLPELSQVCGNSCNFTFVINPRYTASMLNLTMANGIVIGGPNTLFDIMLNATNQTNGAPINVLTLETAMQVNVNFTMSNVVFYPMYNFSDFWDTNVT